MEGLTTVVNLRVESCDVYIGRAPGPRGTFGNPFAITSKRSREQAVQEFKDYFARRMKSDPAFRAAVDALRGKRLGCYCKPAMCHGDVIAAYLNR